jgi:trehalose-phosphatase
MRSLWTDWKPLARELGKKKRLFLLLDFDGTLAPLEDRPQRARLPESTKALIRRLGARPGVNVAVISGRSVRDIRRRVSLRSLYYAGNHGLEIEGPGLSFRHPAGEALRPALTKLAGALRRDVRSLRGVLIENKGPTLSVHYRRLRPGHEKEFAALVQTYRKATRSLPLRWRSGHKVWELVPETPWDKGEAALLLLRRLGHPFAIAVGDDRTDEDMFRAVRGIGLTIGISCLRPSNARYCLASQRETGLLLARLDRALAAGER